MRKECCSDKDFGDIAFIKKRQFKRRVLFVLGVIGRILACIGLFIVALLPLAVVGLFVYIAGSVDAF